MRIWKNTTILDKIVNNISFSNEKRNTEIVLLGSKLIILGEFPRLRGIFLMLLIIPLPKTKGHLSTNMSLR